MRTSAAVWKCEMAGVFVDEYSACGRAIPHSGALAEENHLKGRPPKRLSNRPNARDESADRPLERLRDEELTRIIRDTEQALTSESDKRPARPKSLDQQ